MPGFFSQRVEAKSRYYQAEILISGRTEPDARTWSAPMRRILAIAVIVLGLGGCDVVNTVTEGFKEAKAVESDLEQSVGVKPQVGFNWANGQLKQVTVIFPRMPDRMALPEMAGAVRAAVSKEFKQTPDNIMMGFSLGKGDGKTQALLEREALHP
jgi:hypothetical protein